MTTDDLGTITLNLDDQSTIDVVIPGFGTYDVGLGTRVVQSFNIEATQDTIIDSLENAFHIWRFVSPGLITIEYN